jgi:hypothetical protein
VRLRLLDEMIAAAMEKRNFKLAAELLEQVAKECGNAYTNLRLLAGKRGEAPVGLGIEGLSELLAAIDGSETGTEPSLPP